MSNLRPSIALLSYNRPAYLQKTFDEIRKAGCEYELIVNDDGSNYNNSNYSEILGRVMNHQATTVLFNPPEHNEGVGRSINKCFGIASGDILIKMDTDVELVDDWLVKVLDLFEENPRMGLLGLCHYFHDPVDMRKTLISEENDHDVHTHILGSVFAVRREVYEQFGIGSYSPAFAEDWELMKKIEADPKWYNALPVDPLAKNYGMGLGKSTVALEGDSGEVITASINDKPYLVNPDKYGDINV